MKKERVLVVIPARGGSKRIRGKNIRRFAGKPLISRTIEEARALPFVDRIIVDTDSPKIATIAKKAGAEVLYLRPARLARDSSQIIDSILFLLKNLKRVEKYVPDYILLLQTTSPLREREDIEKSWKRMQKGDVTSVVTITHTHPRLYHMDAKGRIALASGSERQSTNVQEWPEGYVLNGCFVYITKVPALQKERRIITKKTAGVLCPKWRSVDLDTIEDWVIAEELFKNKKRIASAIQKFQ